MGADQTTTYLVQTVYETVDRSSRGVSEISKSMEVASGHAESLRGTLLQLGGLLGGGMIFGEAKKHLVDYNSELEQSKVVIAGMLSMYTGADIEKSWDRAALSVDRFQQMAKVSALTTKDLVDAARGLTRPLIQAGISMSDIEKLTFGVANAAKAFGINGAVAAMDIEQALGHGVSVRDRFAKSILAQKEVGLNKDQFNALSMDKKVEALRTGLTSKAVTSMAKKQGEETFAGVMSTLEDNFQILMGKAGGSLFKSLTDEVKSWNAWIDANSTKIGEMVQRLSDGLMTAFRVTKEIATELMPVFREMFGVVRSVMTFAYEHKDVLMGLAKGLLVYKGASMAGGMAMGLLGGGGGLFGGIGSSLGQIKSGFGDLSSTTSSLGTAFGGLTTVLSGVGGVIGGVAKLSMALYAVSGFLFGKTTSEKQAEARVKAEVLSAQAYDKAHNEKWDILREFQKFGVDPNSSREFWGPMLQEMGTRLEKVSADLDKTEADLIAKGLSAGYIREEITGEGQRKLSLFGSPNDQTSSASLAAMDEMSKSLVSLFRKKIEENVAGSSMAGGGMNYDLGRWYGERGMAGSALQGFFVDTLYKAKKKGAADDDFPATKIAQTIHVTIQRVMAKDPNRWLTELEDEAARRTRAPTRAKGAWKNSGN